jgi:hypothetical protein
MSGSSRSECELGEQSSPFPTPRPHSASLVWYQTNHGPCARRCRALWRLQSRSDRPVWTSRRRPWSMPTMLRANREAGDAEAGIRNMSMKGSPIVAGLKPDGQPPGRNKRYQWRPRSIGSGYVPIKKAGADSRTRRDAGSAQHGSAACPCAPVARTSGLGAWRMERAQRLS